ncbi:MAG: dipeptidase PepE [Rikenellaceae bacterium]|nr:dipeptidase PepE [Rikenellaceae bacterium]
MRLLLISNSTNPGEPYLKYPIGHIGDFLGPVREVLFVPYAGVTFSYDEYLRRVQERFDEIDVTVKSIHRCDDPARAVAGAKAVVVGGGNTFALVKKMQEQGLIEAIRNRVREGVPYIGWSAGSNVACPTLCTTNDMPIVQPASFECTGLVPFQINPHYLDHNPEGHAGETREQRIEEYIEANPGRYVVGLREGCMLRIEDNGIQLVGPKTMRLFRRGDKPRELTCADDFSFLIR